VATQSAAIQPALITPDKLESSIGTLEFKDGARRKETAAKIYDNFDPMHGVEAFDAEFFGSLVAIGIVKGKPFNLDTRMKKSIIDPAEIGAAVVPGSELACRLLSRLVLLLLYDSCRRKEKENETIQANVH
jgi:hypothetical protein